MKNKKPKTIEDILGDAGELLENAFAMEGIVDNTEQEVKKYIDNKVKQIKQLILDEVIVLKTNHVNPNCLDSRCCNNHGETGSVTHDLKRHEEQQRKKLERL